MQTMRKNWPFNLLTLLYFSPKVVSQFLKSIKSDSKCLGQHSIFFNVSQKKNHSAWDKLT